MFFDSRKKVSLGGKGAEKKQESKQQFVERTRKEREAREHERKRERCSLRIQAFVRGRRATAERREFERQGWDESLQKMKHAWAQAADDAASAAVGKELDSLLRRFLFFYRRNNDKDNERLSGIGLWLVVNGTAGPNTRPGVKILSHLYSGADSNDAKRRIQKFCHLCMQRLKRTVTSPPGNVQALDAGVLVRLCNRGAEENRGGMAEQLLESLLAGGLMEVIRARLDADDKEEEAQKQPLQLVLVSLVVQALGGGQVGPVQGAYEGLCAHLLTRSMLFKRLSAPARKVLWLDALWPNVLSALTKDAATLSDGFCGAHSTIEGASYLLGNLVELSTSSLSTSSPKETALFALSAGKLLAHVRQCQDAMGSAGEEEEMEDAEDEAEVEKEHMEVEVETAAGLTRVQHTRIRHKDGVSGTDLLFECCDPRHKDTGSRLSPALAAVKQHVQAICNKEYICKLLDVVQKVPPPAPGASDTPVDAPPQDFRVVSATCGLLMQLLEFLPDAKTDVLNALAFKPAVLSMLWDWFKCVSKGQGDAGADSLLTMFCLVYNHLLMTVDNVEFYENQFPFSLDQVRDMVERLKASVYNLYWDPPPSVVGKRLRASGTALLNRLFERNCFKQFAAPEVLKNVPFALPFPLRLRILRHSILLDKNKLMDIPQNWIPTRVPPPISLRARSAMCGTDKEFNGHVSSRTATWSANPPMPQGLNALGKDLKRTIQISFVSQEGLLEAGIDGGGLFKEFVNTLSGQAFNPHYGLFRSTPDKLLFPNPNVSCPLFPPHVQ